jgi:hypothetical protein
MVAKLSLPGTINQTAVQFYHVSTDNAFPYNVYGGRPREVAL